jgi:hypothetical protein
MRYWQLSSVVVFRRAAMSDFSTVLGTAFRIFASWIAPLGILFSMFTFALRLLRRARTPETWLAARAGLTAGLAIWVYVVYRIPPATIVVGSVPPTSGWLVGLSLVGASLLVGFGFMWLVERWSQTPVVGLLVLVLVMTSTTAAYSYVFSSESREVLITASLFLLVGATFRVMMRSGRFAGLFFHRADDSREKEKS